MVNRTNTLLLTGYRKAIELLLALALVAGSAPMVPVAEAWEGSTSKLDVNRPSLPVSSQLQDPEEVTLTLNSSGFAPAEVTRAAGRFQLSVDNRSGTDDLTLILKTSEGTLIREMRVRSGDWSEVLDLTPGNYTLSEANHSNWTCIFTVHST